MKDADSQRACGSCSLCCFVLRVDEIGKLGGHPCVHQRDPDGCGIHPTRPGICRAYRCLWLSGGLRDSDRPDRLGAVLDLVNQGSVAWLAVRQAEPGAFDRSERLREIAQEFRSSLPVRITDVGAPLDADRPYRVLLPDGEEQRVTGDRVEIIRGGRTTETRRLPWLERQVRRLVLGFRRRRLRRFGSRDAAFRRRTGG